MVASGTEVGELLPFVVDRFDVIVDVEAKQGHGLPQSGAIAVTTSPVDGGVLPAIASANRSACARFLTRIRSICPVVGAYVSFGSKAAITRRVQLTVWASGNFRNSSVLRVWLLCLSSKSNYEGSRWSTTRHWARGFAMRSCRARPHSCASFVGTGGTPRRLPTCDRKSTRKC